jgi:DNA mismatch repair ATPase MutL
VFARKLVKLFFNCRQRKKKLQLPENFFGQMVSLLQTFGE